MEMLLFLLYIVMIVALALWFEHILKKEAGLTDLNWKMTVLVYSAAFGLPSIVVGLLSLLLKAILFILL